MDKLFKHLKLNFGEYGNPKLKLGSSCGKFIEKVE